MDHAEANGKTVDDALKAALSKLNASVDEVDIVVLDEGQRGGRLFGRGARDAVVRVERREGGARESEPEPPDTSIRCPTRAIVPPTFALPATATLVRARRQRWGRRWFVPAGRSAEAAPRGERRA